MGYVQEYNGLLRRTMNGGHETNIRTGRNMLVIHGAVLTADCSNGFLPVPGNRRYFPRTAAAETAWFIKGSRSVNDLRALGVKIWDKFAEDDGSVPNAYGWRWRGHFGRDQVSDAVNALKENKSDRQVVISAWDPSQDGLGRKGGKNIPCPAMFTLNAHHNLLHSTVLMRSSDVFVGLPYDVIGHALLVSAIAEEIGGLLPGTLTFALANAHVYEDHWTMAEESLGFAATVMIRLPRRKISDIERDPLDFVKELGSITNHPFSPKVEAVL